MKVWVLRIWEAMETEPSNVESGLDTLETGPARASVMWTKVAMCLETFASLLTNRAR